MEKGADNFSAFIVDETKSNLPAPHRQFIVYTCVHVTGQAAATVLENLDDLRADLNVEDRDRSFKTPDSFSGKQPVAYTKKFLDAIAGYCVCSENVHRMSTTTKHLEEATASARMTVVGDPVAVPPFSGPEGVHFLNWIKRVALNEGLRPGIVDVVIDSLRALDWHRAGRLIGRIQTRGHLSGRSISWLQRLSTDCRE